MTIVDGNKNDNRVWCFAAQLEENMHKAFAHFDTDGSGTISKDELKEALKVTAALHH
jgi:Ca2+-binding EF-hand superfamily protein